MQLANLWGEYHYFIWKKQRGLYLILRLLNSVIMRYLLIFINSATLAMQNARNAISKFENVNVYYPFLTICGLSGKGVLD